jgi:hypothetical protein
MTVWIYVDVSKEVGDVDHLKVFASWSDAPSWLLSVDGFAETGFKVVRTAYGETFFCKACDRPAVTDYAGPLYSRSK